MNYLAFLLIDSLSFDKFYSSIFNEIAFLQEFEDAN